MSSVIWMIMGLVSSVMVLVGIVLLFLYTRSESVAEDGFTIGEIVTSPGSAMILFGLVMYHVSGRARKAIKRKRAEEGL